MLVTTSQQGDVTVLALKGKITIGVGDVALRDAVREALNGGARKLVLDMSGVSSMDASGIDELVSAHTTTTNQSAKCKLSAIPPKPYDVLVITQLIKIFDVYDTVDEAVASFG